MRNRKVVGLGLAAVVLLAAGGAAALEIGEGMPMGAVKMKNVDGSELSLAGSTGPRGLLVVFTCNHCPWAKAWEGRIVALGNTYRLKGIGVVAVSSNDPKEYPEDAWEEMQKRAKDEGYEFPYVVDATSDAARAFGATKTPEAYLFDVSGKLVYSGAIDDNARDPDAVKVQYLKDALEAVVKGGEVPIKKTKALGCSIKLR